MSYARYTAVLKSIMDTPEGSEALNRALATYPLYSKKNEDKLNLIVSREELNKRLLNHYKYREIGFETVGRFVDELEIAMCEIMPYYNQLFQSQDIINAIDDIFGNIDITETYEEETDVNTTQASERAQESRTTGTANTRTTDQSETASEMESTGKGVRSETPQGNISISGKDIDAVNYADEVNWNKNNTDSKTTNEAETTTDSDSTTEQTSSGQDNTTGQTQGVTRHTLNRKGNQGVNTYAHDMLEFRQLFINVVEQIINDRRIKDLFMQVY